jgi:uncharacterized protein YcbX
VHVDTIAQSPIKGGRHRSHRSVRLERTGPVGDREFCLVDVARGRVLKTVEHRAIIGTEATWENGILSIEIDGRTIDGVPVAAGDVEFDYWGRPAELELLDGPWAAHYSALLGKPVTLARGRRPGEFVYGATVSLMTTAAVRWLERLSGHDVDPARFRSNFTVAAEGDEPVEREWIGSQLRLGEATVRVLEPIGRCAVIDLDPSSGTKDARTLKTLAMADRARYGTLEFGVYAEVTSHGLVIVGDEVALVGAIAPSLPGNVTPR